MSQFEMPKKIVNRNYREEGELTKRVERQTAKIPSLGFLGLAAGSLVASIALFAVKERKDTATFVGQWVPVFLLIGIYNKLVKLEGSEAREHKAAA